MSLVLRMARDMHLCRSSSNVPCLPMLQELLQNPRIWLTFGKVQNPLRLPRSTTSECPKVPWICQLFYTFEFDMCFAPQRRTLFRQLNSWKRSEAEVFCTCWLRDVLRATTACTFSTSQLPKVVRTCSALQILTSKRASRHNSVQFFISQLARWLRTRRSSEPTFRPSGATNHLKNAENRDFSPFFRAPASSFLWLFLFSDLLSSSLLFSSLTLPTPAFPSILSEVWLLNFLRSWNMLFI